MEPVGEEALHDEAPGEGVDGLQAGELEHGAAGAAQAEASGSVRDGSGAARRLEPRETGVEQGEDDAAAA